MYIYKRDDVYMGVLFVGCTNGKGRKYSIAWTRQQEHAHRYKKSNRTLEKYLSLTGYKYQKVFITEQLNEKK